MLCSWDKPVKLLQSPKKKHLWGVGEGKGITSVQIISRSLPNSQLSTFTMCTIQSRSCLLLNPRAMKVRNVTLQHNAWLLLVKGQFHRLDDAHKRIKYVWNKTFLGAIQPKLSCEWQKIVCLLLMLSEVIWPKSFNRSHQGGQWKVRAVGTWQVQACVCKICTKAPMVQMSTNMVREATGVG